MFIEELAEGTFPTIMHITRPWLASPLGGEVTQLSTNKKDKLSLRRPVFEVCWELIIIISRLLGHWDVESGDDTQADVKLGKLFALVFAPSFAMIWFLLGGFGS